MGEYYTPAKTVEEDFVNLVRLELNDIKKTFFKIGFRLSEAYRNRYYKKLGYNSIEECAEALFGFKKTTTYDLMNVWISFADRNTPMMLDSKYSKFSQSQLVLFTSVNYSRDGFIRRCRPEDTIEKLKKAKRYWKELQVGKLCRIDCRNTKTIDELIELVERKCPELKALPSGSSENVKKEIPDIRKTDKIENSGCPEKEPEVNIVLDVPESEIETFSEDVTDEPQEGGVVVKKEVLRRNMINFAGKRLDFLDYKTIFDPENKGLGVRIPADHVSLQVLINISSYVRKNRTDVKNTLQEYLETRIGQFQYEINLCGRKQGLHPFCGNVSNYVIDFLLEVFSLEAKNDF